MMYKQLILSMQKKKYQNSDYKDDYRGRKGPSSGYLKGSELNSMHNQHSCYNKYDKQSLTKASVHDTNSRGIQSSEKIQRRRKVLKNKPTKKQNGVIDEKQNSKRKTKLSRTPKAKQFTIKIPRIQCGESPKAINRCNTKQKLLNLPQPSYRQYCIVGDKFLPLVTSNQKRYVNDLFIATASTSPELTKTEKVNNKKLGKEILNELNLLIENKRKRRGEKNHQYTDQFPKEWVSVAIQTTKRQMKNQSILVHAAKQQFGTQYSDRKQGMTPQFLQSTKAKKPAEQPTKYRDNILEQIMNFGDKNEYFFEKMPIQQKRHYRQFFSTLIDLVQSPRLQKPINRQSMQDMLIISQLKKCSKSFLPQQFDSEKLEQQVLTRQAQQIGQIPIIDRSYGINTSLTHIIAFYTDFLCYIEINYLEEFLKAINKMYGWSYMDKFKFISKLYQDNQRESTDESVSFQVIKLIACRQSSINVIRQQILNQFFEETLNSGKFSQQFIRSAFQCHYQAVFSCINQLLRTYQPFYLTKGDPFPWSLNIFKCITFYAIDQNSIETVLTFVQNSLCHDIANTLCGLHIKLDNREFKDYRKLEVDQQLIANDPLYSHRIQKETKMMIDEVKGIEQYSEMQIEITCLLFEMSTKVIEDLWRDQIVEIAKILQRDTHNLC